jgi:hypothetical protein
MDRGHPVRQRAKDASDLLETFLGRLFALRAQADKMSAIRFYLCGGRRGCSSSEAKLQSKLKLSRIKSRGRLAEG